jgi:hypothetical protein
LPYGLSEGGRWVGTDDDLLADDVGHAGLAHQMTSFENDHLRRCGRVGEERPRAPDLERPWVPPD